MIRKTWRERADLVSWTWALPARGQLDGAWAWEQVTLLQSLAFGFARVAAISVYTQSEDNEHRYDLEEQWTQAKQAVRSCSDFCSIHLELQLECISPRGKEAEFTIPHGALLIVSVSRTDDGRVDESRAPSLHLSLNADIYDPDSPEDDNEEMATANGPRLTLFLHRVEEAGAEFESLDWPYCPGAHRYGFLPNR